MNSKIRLSRYACILTLIVNIVLIVCCILTFNEKSGFWVILAIWLIFFVFGLLYGPLRITADPTYVVVKSMLLKHKLLVRNMKSVELFQPTMGAYRLCASGGYFGYWGLFREGDIGRYVAYYGKASDCFLIRMKNGDKYVLGCENPDEMVAYIKDAIRNMQSRNSDNILNKQ